MKRTVCLCSSSSGTTVDTRASPTALDWQAPTQLHSHHHHGISIGKNTVPDIQKGVSLIKDVAGLAAILKKQADQDQAPATTELFRIGKNTGPDIEKGVSVIKDVAGLAAILKKENAFQNGPEGDTVVPWSKVVGAILKKEQP